ncbi:MAG: hypothetical protein Kow0026_27000 [Oricola sp.]
MTAIPAIGSGRLVLREHREAEGKGYALEAMRGVTARCDASHPRLAMSCIVDPGNARSPALAGKPGFREVARSPYLGKTIDVMLRDAVRAGRADRPGGNAGTVSAG